MFRTRISAGVLGALAAVSLAAAPAAAQYYGGGGYYQQTGHHRDHHGYGDGYDRGGGGHRGYGNGYGYDDRGRPYGRNGYYSGRGYRGNRERCDRGTGGTIIGAIAGGLLGNTVTGRGDHTVGTIVGAGAGALAGRAIDRDC